MFLLYTDWVDYVAEGMKSNAFMHNFVPGGGVVLGGVTSRIQIL